MKRAILFPFLFILYAILNAVYTNLGQIDPLQALRPLLVLSALAGLSILCLGALLKDRHYAGYLSFLFLAYVILFGHLHNLLRNWPPLKEKAVPWLMLVVWSIPFIILSARKLWTRFGGARRVTPALNLVLALALLIQFVATLIQYGPAAPLQIVYAGEDPAPETVEELTLDCTTTPDIYYIVLDGYGRQDVLDKQYGVDTRSFLSSLEQKGFDVAGESHSNYIQTVYSLASSLNFRFINPEPQGTSGFQYFSDLVSDNRVTALLEQCGYQTIAFESGFFFTERPDVDTYLTDDGFGLSGIENLLLAGTPLEMLANALKASPPDFSYEAHRERILFAFDELQRIPQEPQPTFVFAHIISPHPPFVFDAQGNSVEPNFRYSLNDGDDYHGTNREYRKGYAAQVQFINQKLLEAVDAILATSETPPVIILQGDHGPGRLLDWYSPARSCLWERTTILNAYYLPGESVPYLPESITPVNTFRVVLNTYFGTDLELLADKTYFTSHRLPRKMFDITPRRDSPANCK